MKLLIKTALVLALLFAGTFLITRFFNLLTLESIERFLHSLQYADPFLVAGVVITLLVVDLFIAVPTMTVIIFSGYSLGVAGGAFSSIIGLTISGSLGYLLSRRMGEKILLRITKNPAEIDKAKAIFQSNGPALLILCRAAPILPEISSCLAGLSKMPYLKYLIWYMAGSIPYAFISAYAGSISSFNNPKPAIFTAIGVTTFLWLIWYIYNYRRKKTTSSNLPSV